LREEGEPFSVGRPGCRTRGLFAARKLDVFAGGGVCESNLVDEVIVGPVGFLQFVGNETAIG
jgi:hypothetical protein